MAFFHFPDPQSEELCVLSTFAISAYVLATSRKETNLLFMSDLSLTPSQNETVFGDETLVGMWATFLPEALSKPQRPPWCSYAVSLNNKIVGLGSFKGLPDDNGSVELSYLTFQTEQGRGIAKGICSALISIAHAANISKIVAHTLPEENASTAVLKANRFIFVGPVQDLEDGCVWRWSLNSDRE